MLPSELPDQAGLFVAVDTETSGLHPDDGCRVAVVSAAWRGDDGQLVAVAWPFGVGRDLGQRDLFYPQGGYDLPELEWQALLDWLAHQHLIFHNAKFDLTMLAAGTKLGYTGRDLLANLHWDTVLGSKELDPLASAELEAVAKRAGCARENWKFKLRDHLRRNKIPAKRYDLADWNVLEPYAATDAEMTLGVWEDQSQRFECGEGSLARLRFKLAVLSALYRMEGRGIGFDAAACLEAADEVALRANAQAAILPFAPNTPAAKRYFFKDQGILPYKATEKRGEPMLDDEVLRRMIEDGHRFAREYSDWSDLDRAYSMWYRGYPDKLGVDGRLRTVYRQTKVVSGRMSVERVQLQAIPKDDKQLPGIPTIRSFFQAREGYELWNLDLGQAELRVATKYAGCEHMAKLLSEGADLHGVTTTQIFGITPDHPDFKVKRDMGKRLTFAAIFNIGAKTYQAELARLADIRLPLPECEQIVRAWRSLYPEFGRAYRRADKLVQHRGYVRIMPGTDYEDRSWFQEYEKSHTAWSRMVQGSLALFNQVWLVETERRWPGLLVLNVHDSQVLELPVGEAADIAQEVALYSEELASSLFGCSMTVDLSPWHK